MYTYVYEEHRYFYLSMAFFPLLSVVHGHLPRPVTCSVAKLNCLLERLPLGGCQVASLPPAVINQTGAHPSVLPAPVLCQALPVLFLIFGR